MRVLIRIISFLLLFLGILLIMSSSLSFIRSMNIVISDIRSGLHTDALNRIISILVDYLILLIVGILLVICGNSLRTIVSNIY